MAIEGRPATVFDDVQTMVGPKRADANVCSQQDSPLGVLAFDSDEVVSWAAVHPRTDTSFARNRKIPHVVMRLDLRRADR